MHVEVLFDPLLPWPAVVAFAAAAAALLARKLVARHPGAALRFLLVFALLGAIANPSLKREIRESRDDVVVIVEDRSASMEVGGRTVDLELAAAQLKEDIEALGRIEVEMAVFRNGGEAEGSAIFAALTGALAGIDRTRPCRGDPDHRWSNPRFPAAGWLPVPAACPDCR